MYITITPQNLNENFSQSVTDFVSYLEKENEGKDRNEIEFFFDQYGDKISAKEVIYEIDQNTSKLKKKEPKFYSLTVNPSQRELAALKNNAAELKKYIREIMKDYAASFNREINGRVVSVDDIRYYAKIEHNRTFKHFDRAVRENLPYHKKILQLKNELNQIKEGKMGEMGNILTLQKQITKLKNLAPHKIHGKMIIEGMSKPGDQSHIHIIVSRKDISDTYSLSPGSRYRASSVIFNGKKVQRGFDRDLFFSKAENTFNKIFNYQRNYVETYNARKIFKKHPEKYMASVLGLPLNEKMIALKILNQSGLSTAAFNIPVSQVQLAIRTLKKLKKGLDMAIRSSSIGI